MPFNVTDCGLPAALSVIESVPVLGAVPVGVNVTWIVQEAFCAIPAPVVEQVPPLATANGPVVEIFENVTFVADGLLLSTVTIIALLVVFNACCGKVKLGGETCTVICAAEVVPLSATLCGFPVALSRIVSVPELGAVPVGVKLTRIVHELSGVIPAPPKKQVPPGEIANGPLVDALAITAFAALVGLFVTVTARGCPVVLMACAGNVMLAGSEIVSGETPVPDKVTVCTVFGPSASLVTVNVPSTSPVPVGAKLTLTLQLCAEAKEAPQVVVRV